MKSSLLGFVLSTSGAKARTSYILANNIIMLIIILSAKISIILLAISLSILLAEMLVFTEQYN